MPIFKNPNFDFLKWRWPAVGLSLLIIGAGVVAAMQGRLALGIDNLFDVRYRDILSRFRYFVDEPGRNATLRVSIPLG